MKVGICTLGCKVNTYESEYIINILKKECYIIADFNEKCDIYIINTCSVTNSSDSKSRKMIRHAKRLNPDSCVIALGCFIEANKKGIMESLPEVDIAIGNKDKSKIVSIINEYFANKERINNTYETLDSKFEDMFIENYNTRTRAFVKVQDGCENFCSYCIIPRVRGKCRSKDLSLCVKEIEAVVNNGYKEVVLTGIHTGNYGVDLGITFADLLKQIVQIKGLKRLRISSIEITELTDEVLDIIAKNDVIVNHMHIPIQSGSNKVLKLMNRKYDIDYFIKKIDKIKEIKKDILITTDIITGHPGEDEESFEETLKNIKRIGFAKLHVFPYSIRKNTPSALLPQVKDSMKKEHTKKLLDLSLRLEKESMERFVGKTMEVLIEREKDGYSYGHTTNYLEVKIMKEIPSSTIVKVLIEKVDYPYCIGRIV